MNVFRTSFASSSSMSNVTLNPSTPFFSYFSFCLSLFRLKRSQTNCVLVLVAPSWVLTHDAFPALFLYCIVGWRLKKLRPFSKWLNKIAKTLLFTVSAPNLCHSLHDHNWIRHRFCLFTFQLNLIHTKPNIVISSSLSNFARAARSCCQDNCFGTNGSSHRRISSGVSKNGFASDPSFSAFSPPSSFLSSFSFCHHLLRQVLGPSLTSSRCWHQPQHQSHIVRLSSRTFKRSFCFWFWNFNFKLTSSFRSRLVVHSESCNNELNFGQWTRSFGRHCWWSGQI